VSVDYIVRSDEMQRLSGLPRVPSLRKRLTPSISPESFVMTGKSDSVTSRVNRESALLFSLRSRDGLNQVQEAKFARSGLSHRKSAPTGR